MSANLRVSPPSAELYKALSIECFYDYLRFEAFQNFSAEKRKQLILTAFKVPLKKDDIMNTMFTFIKEGNIDGALAFLTEKSLKDLPPSSKNIESMFATYFAETDRPRSLKLLRFLMNFPPTQKAAFENFLEQYSSLTPEKREQILPNVIYNAFTF
jgi:hypothetical protein